MARSTQKTRLSDACAAMETIAPLRLAQSWDNVGLLAGDLETAIRRVLLCIDLTPVVVDEAVRKRVQLVMAYHPPLFKPIHRLTTPGTDTAALLFRCIEKGIAVYSVHTALDAAEGGTNDRIAELCGIAQAQPLEFVGGEGAYKVVVFVPAEHVDAVADAMFKAGAGWIGDYERCSFRTPGTGTFRGGKSTNPTIGRAGRNETIDEVRLESVTPRSALPAVIDAIRRVNPYDEPAFDIYPMAKVPTRGIGRYGNLPKSVTPATLARRLKKAIGAGYTQIVGNRDQQVTRAVICVGSAGSLPFKLSLSDRDVIITGEIRHHDALTIERHGCSAVALGHWSSERPVLEPFARALSERLPALEVIVSEADHDPFVAV